MRRDGFHNRFKTTSVYFNNKTVTILKCSKPLKTVTVLGTIELRILESLKFIVYDCEMVVLSCF
jgi:hypothetical protein